MLVSLLVCGCEAQLLPSYGEDLVPGYSESLDTYTQVLYCTVLYCTVLYCTVLYTYTQADPGLDIYTQDTVPMSGLDMLRMSVPGSPGQASTGDIYDN